MNKILYLINSYGNISLNNNINNDFISQSFWKKIIYMIKGQNEDNDKENNYYFKLSISPDNKNIVIITNNKLYFGPVLFIIFRI